jgi:putative heme iron utilization protein
MGRPSRSLQFYNGAGEAMLKAFVRRHEHRDLIAEQVVRQPADRRFSAWPDQR